jgi:GNAT superfamily N-acetyltransferase
MNPLTVRPVRTRQDRDRFIRLQWTMNEHLEKWVPPLLLDRRLLMDRKKNPFYLHSEAEFFIAERDGTPVGRIGAILNNNHNREHNENIGFFGFFECADDRDVARALFDAAEEWLRRKGVTAVRGPANPSVNDEYGLLVDGFDELPAIMMPYNPRYYAGLIEGAGYSKARDLYAYALQQSSFRSEKMERVTAALAARSGVTIRPISKADFHADVERIRALYAGAWQHNWGAVPLTREEFDFVAKSMKPIMQPSLVLIAEAAGVPVGFGLSLPDYNQVLKDNRRGWLLPGLFRMLFMKKKIDRVRILVLGVLPDRLRTGAGSLLMYETGRQANALGYPGGEASWVLEDNVMMNRAAEFMSGTRSKVYRIYEKPF